jgi:hypothetical protein
MPVRISLLLATVVLLLSPCAFAQKGSHVLNLTDGFVTMHQVNGVTPTSDMAYPFPITGAVFLSYRYFVVRGLAVGVAAGIDNQWGHIKHGTTEYPGTFSGTSFGEYYRSTKTIAGEVQVNYVTGSRVLLYGTAGAGYTFSKLERDYDMGPGPDVPNDYVDESIVNYHVTAFGMRTLGRAAFMLECGAGYKGVFSLGFSYRLSEGRQASR